jgi:hypothetical protein
VAAPAECVAPRFLVALALASLLACADQPGTAKPRDGGVGRADAASSRDGAVPSDAGDAGPRLARDAAAGGDGAQATADGGNDSGIDDCVGHTCRNGASCNDLAGEYACECLPGYSGTRCELPAGAPAQDIACPASGRPEDGWPLVFTFNGNCFKAVNAAGMAGDAASALVSDGQACAVAIGHGDLQDAADIDALVRTEIVPRIVNNRGLVNTQKIGALGFSAGGSLASYLGTRWGLGVDPADGTDHAFRVGAVVNLYGPLRMDRSHATDGAGLPNGGGGLLYLHETRAAGLDVDIPGARRWDASNCFCATRGTSPCDCQTASSTYLAAYQPAAGICGFALDDASLEIRSATHLIEVDAPVHVAALYLCSGWKDSNVDHDTNLHQALFHWRPEHRITVTADDGHGFPLSVCEASADAAQQPRPLAWLLDKLSVFGAYPPAEH